MYVSGVTDCPTSPDYGLLVTDGATVYNADGLPTRQRIYHGSRVDILAEESGGFYRVRYAGRIGYVQSLMLVDYDPAQGVRPKPADCW